MVVYRDFVALSQSGNSDDRGQAAHFAAMAYLGHHGPADEHAALYAALIGFLDDPSVKVRAALAYGLLHAVEAPRPVLLSLLHDSPVIARAVVQYSPALIDADLLPLVARGDESMLLAMAMRERISSRLAEALVERGGRQLALKLLQRPEVPFSADLLSRLAHDVGLSDPELRGVLFEREELPGVARLALVRAVTDGLRHTRMVRGAIGAPRLERLLRYSLDTALTAIGEVEAAAELTPYATELIAGDEVSTRVLLHALVQGHVLFFADCVTELSELPREKVLSLLEAGSRAALNALLARCGLPEAIRNLIARLVFLARTADLVGDVAARHFVVTVLTEELITDHRGVIPPDLEEAFAYLSEQNVRLARQAASGVLAGFSEEGAAERPMPLPGPDACLSIAAA